MPYAIYLIWVKPGRHMLLWFYWGISVLTRRPRPAWLDFATDRGWRIHKQSIFLPGPPLEAIPAAFSFSAGSFKRAACR
jgi:hypothetical protein